MLYSPRELLKYKAKAFIFLYQRWRLTACPLAVTPLWWGASALQWALSQRQVFFHPGFQSLCHTFGNPLGTMQWASLTFPWGVAEKDCLSLLSLFPPQGPSFDIGVIQLESWWLGWLRRRSIFTVLLLVMTVAVEAIACQVEDRKPAAKVSLLSMCAIISCQTWA
jgi:hypothetical protein